MIVPFLIPKKYHKGRFVVDVTNFSRPKASSSRKWGDVEWIRYHIREFAEGIEGKVSDWLATNGKQRVYLGPLTDQLEKRSYHLVPSQAVAIRGQIEEKIQEFGNNFFDVVLQRFDIHVDKYLDFFTAYALQNLGGRYKMEVSVCFDLDESNELLLAFAGSNNACALRLFGPCLDGVRDLLDYYSDSQEAGGSFTGDDLRDFPLWMRTHESFQKLLRVLARRAEPLLLDVTGQALHPDDWYALQQILGVTLVDDNREMDKQDAVRWWKDDTETESTEEGSMCETTDAEEDLNESFDQMSISDGSCSEDE